MTAEIMLGKKWEGGGMSAKTGHNNNDRLIIEKPDEDWWAAILAEEPHGKEMADPAIPVEFIESSENEGCIGQTHAELSQSNPTVDWDWVKKIFVDDEIVSLNVVGYNKGGILVSCEKSHGFVPASHLIDLPPNLSEREREHYLTSYLERSIPLKVIEWEQDNDRVVFSERAALAKQGQRRRLLRSLKPGDSVRGEVTNITSFGVFVDLGGLEGLIHLSELSWGRVQHPSEIVKIDDEIESIVIEVLEDQGRVGLSLKRLTENPWDSLSDKLSPGDVINAVISCIVRYGAFARIDDGVEGLIHISLMNFPQDCTRIDDFLYEGQSVKVCVLNVDPEKRRLGLRLMSYQ